MEEIILVGYGGHAKSVADCIERQGKYRILGYTDVVQHEGTRYPYLGTDEVLQQYYTSGVRNAAICIGYLGRGDLRQRLYTILKKIGYYFPVIVDPSAIVSETAQIGEGTFIGKSAIINSDAKIGIMTIINTMSLIEHECTLGNFVHVAVSAVLCGQVCVGDGALIGANATVLQCKKIKCGQIVPAGATVR